MKAAVVVFPGSNCDRDCEHVLANVMGADVRMVWHRDAALPPVDLVVIPGGFSYGDYLRTGALAACSPIMDAVRRHAG
ncbi:MAG TPA: phosphoribosylformylglycinamidine synthase subunit PurQ, partial [Nitrospiria bacterium]|nr:phosphoribosylformylglycinamidine synthase subunit PurQ [Nitrospiria bacterium]